jgi:hypothetical protein
MRKALSPMGFLWFKAEGLSAPEARQLRERQELYAS